MYTLFHAQNFRCFHNLRVDGLQRVNLIAGGNGIGKTALLEAIFLHCGAFNPTLVLSVAGLRGIEAYRVEFGRPVEPPWRSLFSEMDESREIKLIGHDSSKAMREVRLRLASRTRNGKGVVNGKGPPASEQVGVGTTAAALTQDENHVALEWEYRDEERRGKMLLFIDGSEFKTEPATIPKPAFEARFLTARWRPTFKEDAEFFGELELVSEQDRVIRVLKLIEPRIRRLSTILIGGQPMLHADIGLPRLVPVAFLGDGLLRLTRLVLAILHTTNGVILVDEFENGLHHSVLKQLWATLRRSAEEANVQVFATTHSRECVVAAHRACSETINYDFSLQRLEKGRDGIIRAIAYDKEALEGALLTGFEVR